MSVYRFSVVVERDIDSYFAFCPELQGCYTQGETYEEVIENIEDAIRLHIEDRVKSGEEIPRFYFIFNTTINYAYSKCFKYL